MNICTHKKNDIKIKYKLKGSIKKNKIAKTRRLDVNYTFSNPF